MSRKTIKILGSVGLNVFIIIAVYLTQFHKANKANSYSLLKNERMTLVGFTGSFKIDHL